MRYAVEKRLRVTGMEIDILAKGLDQPRQILVECKAQRDALPADVITKLLGNVAIRGADSGWLFSTSDLGKDGRGQWEEIRNQAHLASKFAWYPPDRLLSILIDQKSILDPEVALRLHVSKIPELGDATLVWAPAGKYWLIEMLHDGLPALYTVLDAKNGNTLSETDAAVVAKLSDRFSALEYHELRAASLGLSQVSMRSPIARVVSGDTWDDLRPARPNDFVGRDDLIKDILSLSITSETATRQLEPLQCRVLAAGERAL